MNDYEVSGETLRCLKKRKTLECLEELKTEKDFVADEMTGLEALRRGARGRVGEMLKRGVRCLESDMERGLRQSRAARSSMPPRYSYHLT